MIAEVFHEKHRFLSSQKSTRAFYRKKDGKGVLRKLNNNKKTATSSIKHREV